MKKQHNLKYEIKSEINIVPFLDVLLVLLIIFMIMPSKLLIQQQDFKVNLTENSNVTTDVVKNKKFLITIEILGVGMYDLIAGNKRISNISSDALISEIYSIKITNPNITCLITASKEEKYNEIVQALNILNNIGINSIGMITNPLDTTIKNFSNNK